MPEFIPGLQLNKGFYHDVVGPLMKKHFPDLQYSAGLVGHGSDVLGFDTPKSMDHNWGPHLHIFFSETDFIAYKTQVDQMLRTHLPYSYQGFSTNFKEGDRYRKDIPEFIDSGEVHHLFEFWTARSFFIHYLGFDIEKKPTYRDWLLFPQQALLEVTTGELFHDELSVQKYRDQFAYFPDDIWIYMMRIQWGKILDEMQTQARSGEVHDEVGALVVTARTVHKIMMLCFLLERTYAPYSKWFGSMFKRLDKGQELYPLLLQLLRSSDWRERQELLAKTYQKLGEMHNKLDVTEPLSTELMDFFGRGHPVINLWEYVEKIGAAVKNEKLRNMKYTLGSVDQFIDHARINHMDYFYTELKEVIR